MSRGDLHWVTLGKRQGAEGGFVATNSPFFWLSLLKVSVILNKFGLFLNYFSPNFVHI